MVIGSINTAGGLLASPTPRFTVLQKAGITRGERAQVASWRRPEALWSACLPVLSTATQVAKPKCVDV